MLSAVFINKSPVTMTQATPIARLTGEYEVLVVSTASKLQTMADLVAMYKANPGNVSWGGGLAGGVDQLTAGMIVQAIGGELGKFNYVAFNSGGEVLAQTMGGHLTVGLGGYNEYAAQIAAGKLRALAITAPKRLDGVNIPTLKEQGIDVEFVNWRGLMGAPGISDAQRQALVRRWPTWSGRRLEGHREEERVARPVHGRRRVQGLRRGRAEVGAEDGDRPRVGEEMSTLRRSSVHVGEVLLSLVLVFIGAFVIYETQGIAETQGYSQVGPRLFPYIIGTGLTLCGAVLGWHAIAGGWRDVPLDQPGHDAPDWTRRDHQRPSCCTWC